MRNMELGTESQFAYYIDWGEVSKNNTYFPTYSLLKRIKKCIDVVAEFFSGSGQDPVGGRRYLLFTPQFGS